VTLLSWIDFEHPVFVPFQGSQYNDFSSVHFYSYIPLKPVESAAPEAARVIARYEAEQEPQPPALLEWRAGQGTLMLWAFTPSLQQSNLPKSIRFLPLLYETLHYLGGGVEERQSLVVGERIPPLLFAGTQAEAWQLQYPQEDSLRMLTAAEATHAAARLLHAGFLSLKPRDAEDWLRVEAVNIQADESSQTPIDVEEFRWRFSTAPVAASEAPAGETGGEEAFFQHHRVYEYGLGLLTLLLLCSLIELIYAQRLSSAQRAGNEGV
jgi:hypothetical protein